MKKENPKQRGNKHPSAENKRNHSGPSGPAKRHESNPSEGSYGIGENQAGQDNSSTDSSNRNNSRDQDPIQTNDTPANEKTDRGYQDMNNRNLEQDFNKNLDEDVVNHYDSETGFDEFDEYADENVDSQGLDQEYNVRYNDDRNEENEIEELHTDTELSRDLTEREISAEDVAPQGKQKPSATVTNKYRPIAETEDESDNNDVDQHRLKKGIREAEKEDQSSLQRKKGKSK